jgi:site-specific recombinase XerD
MPQTTPISPLRQRLIDDMTLRNFSPKTHWAYVHGVKILAEFLRRSPDKASADDLRLFRLHLVDRGYSVHMINQSLAALRFFYRVTAPRDDLVATIPYIKQPEQLPVVLSQDEVVRLLAAAPGFKYQVMLSTCYAAGLRVSELVNLKVADIDSSRMVIRIEQSKGNKDRYVMLSPDLLAMLRKWYRFAHPEYWLFPGMVAGNPLTTNIIRWAVRRATQTAGIKKRVSPHTLRHSFACHLLENKTDIRVIQVLLGHARIESTNHYARIALGAIGDLTSPFDLLPKDAAPPA